MSPSTTRRPKLDVLHVCLILAGGVLVLALLSGFGFLARRTSEEWRQLTLSSVEEFKSWYGLAALLLAVGLTSLGWFRWMKLQHGPPPA